mmetsp:Transcript_26401/g.23332  ORF Transcript_26401/g.23332 Transcript_26401/m.23332 type:complete len:103 (+) Transcript_26401:13-321(+)
MLTKYTLGRNIIIYFNHMTDSVLKEDWKEVAIGLLPMLEMELDDKSVFSILITEMVRAICLHLTLTIEKLFQEKKYDEAIDTLKIVMAYAKSSLQKKDSTTD